MLFHMSETGKDIARMQKGLADYYKYTPLPPEVAFEAMARYIKCLPQEFYEKSEFIEKGAQIRGRQMNMVTLSDTPLANRYERIVIGHYGAFIEISDENINKLFLKVKEGEEYRINNPHYTDRVKYEWWTTKDDSDCKLYYQKRTVDYADYRPGYWYISPYEVRERYAS